MLRFPSGLALCSNSLTTLSLPRSKVVAIYACRPFKNGARVAPEDEVVVRDVLKYHPKCDEKVGPGIDHIKVM